MLMAIIINFIVLFYYKKSNNFCWSLLYNKWHNSSASHSKNRTAFLL